MESQKDQQQEQTLSQEGLHSLEEEQLQDVTGGGKLGKFLSCFACGKPKQQDEWVPVSSLVSGASSPVSGPRWSIPSRSSHGSVHGLVQRRAFSDPSLHDTGSSGSTLPPLKRTYSL